MTMTTSLSSKNRFTSLPVPIPLSCDDRQQLPGSSPAKSLVVVYDSLEFPDERLFDTTIHYPALSVPVQETANIRKQLKNHVLKGVKNVYVDDKDSERRIVVLKLVDSMNVPDSIRQYETEYASLFDDILKRSGVQWHLPDYAIVKHYKDQSAEQLLRKLLPSQFEVPTGYERVGSILHVNLREELLPFKYFIGKIFLDTHTNIQTVVNKTSEIDNQFRTLEMEVIAGNQSNGWSITEVREHGCSFTMDYKLVYWNSRLAGEHERLVKLITALSLSSTQTNSSSSTDKETIVVADVMAGIGPFAVPLAKQSNITVLANDLNPASVKYLEINAKANGCQNNIHIFKMDAPEFITEIQNNHPAIHHVIMNLPASAPEFLDAFRGWKLSTFPLVHVHCFDHKPTDKNPSATLNDVYGESVKRCEEALGCPITDPNIHVVRNVAPTKNMLCISFRLPKAVADLPERTAKRRRKT